MAFEYRDTFISVADDCSAEGAEIPPAEYRGKPTQAAQEFAMMHGHDFEHTMSEVQSSIWVERKGGSDLSADERDALTAEYFSTGRACFRASPLAKRYGWGFVFDADGKVALVASDSDEYAAHAGDDDLDQLKAMKSRRSG